MIGLRDEGIKTGKEGYVFQTMGRTRPDRGEKEI